MKKFLYTALAGLSALATATPSLAGNTFDDHVDLYKALQEVGVTIKLNHKARCSSGETDGGYASSLAFMVICQDNAVAGGEQVNWTDNDLDTLRHEAHHVIQDCNEGTISDGRLGLFFYEEGELEEFLSNSSWTREQLIELVKVLREQGLSWDEVKIELEAYTVASDIDASLIAKKVRQFCGS